MDRLREEDRQIHFALYNNVQLLSTAHDNPKLYDGTRLQTCLHPDMFINTNKFAFEQITYFLLNIIDKNLLKSIPWPLLDKKLESEFRSKVKQILNDLNSKYEDARIPSTQTSQMITPGGIKIAKILFYLSELAMLLYIEKLDEDDEDEPTLLPFVAGSNVSNQLRNVDNVIKYENDKCFTVYNEINYQINETIQTAKNYSSKLLPLREELEQLKQTVNEVHDDNFLEFIMEITKILNELKEHETLIEGTRDVIHATITNVNDSGFTYENHSFNLRQNIARLILNNENELHLKELLKLIDNVLNDFVINLKQQPMLDLTQLDDLSLKIIQDYELFLHKIETDHNPELKEINNLLLANIDKYNEELLNKFNADDSYLKKLTTPGLEFDIPVTANHDFRSKLTATSLIRRTSFFDTLTTAKKRARKINNKNVTPNAKRNLMGINKQTATNLPPNANSTLQLSTLSTTTVNNHPPKASSTPEIVVSSSSSGRNHTSNLRHLLTNDPLAEESTPNASLNISEEILDVFQLNDELDSTKLFSFI